MFNVQCAISFKTPEIKQQRNISKNILYWYTMIKLILLTSDKLMCHSNPFILIIKVRCNFIFLLMKIANTNSMLKNFFAKQIIVFVQKKNEKLHKFSVLFNVILLHDMPYCWLQKKY